MTERLVWTDEGRANLQRLLTRGGTTIDAHVLDDEALRRMVARRLNEDAAAWQRGLHRSDDVGRAAVAYAAGQISAGELPSGATAGQAAGVASMLGAHEGERDLAAFAELLVRRRGLRFALEVLVQTWGQRTARHSPDGPRSETRLELSLQESQPDDSSHLDASISYGKAQLAAALARRHRAIPDSHGEAREALDALWSQSPLAGRVALAVATNDSDRAAELAELLLERESRGAVGPWPHYPWRALPDLVRDVDLLERMRGARHWEMPTLRMLDNIGGGMIDLYERVLGSRIPKAGVLEQMANLRGPRTARCMARFAERSSAAKIVRAYFAANPDLLALATAEPEDEAHAARLTKLKSSLQKGENRPTKRKARSKAARKNPR